MILVKRSKYQINAHVIMTRMNKIMFSAKYRTFSCKFPMVPHIGVIEVNDHFFSGLPPSEQKFIAMFLRTNGIIKLVQIIPGLLTGDLVGKSLTK